MQSDYKTPQEKIFEISSLPEKTLDNFVCDVDKLIENEEVKKQLQKKCSSFRISQKKKRESYKKSKRLDKLALELLKCHSTERQLFEVNSSRGPLVTFASGVFPHSIHLIFSNSLCVPLEKLEKGGVFNPEEYLGCWYAKKTNIEFGEFLEFRIEFLKINELKQFMKRKFNKPNVKLENLVFQFSTNSGVFLSPPFDITSKLILKSTKRVAIYVESTQCFFYALPSSKEQTREEIQTSNNVQSLSNQDFVSPFNREDAFSDPLPNSFTSDKTSSDFQDESIPYFLLTPEQIFSSEIPQTQAPSDFNVTLSQTQNPSDFDETYFDFSLSNDLELNFELETQI